MNKIKSVIGIAAGKGGVGKSTAAVLLALALKSEGYRVGILDADLYGPSLQKMVPCETVPRREAHCLIPAYRGGMPLMTMAYFRDENTPLGVRAPLANGIIQQFIHEVEWGELDILLVDFPPGTGDIPLTLLQNMSLSGVVLVTTPQEVALIDVQKVAQLFLQMGVPLIGLVENMSYYLCEGKVSFPFGTGGGRELAIKLKIPFLKQVPLDPEISRCADAGLSIFEHSPQSRGASAFLEIAREVGAFKSPPSLKEIVLKETATFLWEDKGEAIWEASELQKKCPCTRCQGEGNAEEGVQILNVERIGGYAVKFAFSTGCSQGIYPLTKLRK